MATAQPATGGRPAAPATMAQCGPTNPQRDGQTALVKGLHTSFTPAHPTEPHTITVTGVVTQGSTAQVTGDHIVVDGSKLSDIVNSHSTGGKSGTSDLTIKAIMIKSDWYMGDSQLDF
ncbi:hypothetical protein [Streptomyces sp. CA-111067]|uniref:hypothetical protein n=1 Tax=Streptomyces sp. CA-111067 TaxID=3240046 RepID=UPI003D969CC6